MNISPNDNFLSLGDRRLAVLDLETTSLDIYDARIVEIAYVIFAPKQPPRVFSRKINPKTPIAPEAIATHGLTQELLAGEPTFEQLSTTILQDLEECDLAGFNIDYFDLPILCREFQRVGVNDFAAGRKIIDAKKIYHKNETRRLTDAVRLYLGIEHDEAHQALGDAMATAAVLSEQIKRYSLPSDIISLADYCDESPKHFADRTGKITWRYSYPGIYEQVFNFGKHAGKSLRKVAYNYHTSTYFGWLMTSEMSEEIKKIAAKANKDIFEIKMELDSATITLSKASLEQLENFMIGVGE